MITPGLEGDYSPYNHVEIIAIPLTYLSVTHGICL